MFNQEQKSQFKILVSSPQWKLIQQMADILIQRINENSSIRSTPDETLVEVYLKEGKIEGIKMLLQELFQNAQ